MSKKVPLFGNKEDISFREALKLYDAKEYKKALKLVDQILKKKPNHAESLTLKGCIFFFTENKDEALNYIRKGCDKAPTNHLVSHLAGIYYRNVDNYPEAAKWYQLAIDNGSLNKQILRDLSTMQVQIRDYKGLKVSRQLYLEENPGYRANWTGNAVAQHLNGENKAAALTLSKIEGLIREHLQDSDRIEHSECLLYKAMILIESFNYKEALKELIQDEPDIKDKQSYLEYKALCHFELGEKDAATKIYRQLIQRNPDNQFHYHQLENSLGSNAEGFDVEIRLKLYDRLAKFYPRSDPPVFLPLTFLDSAHPQFEIRVKSYILSQLKRGTPATFVNIKPLLKTRGKLEIIQKVVMDFFENEVAALGPTVYVWTLYFLAQYYLNLAQLDKAFEYINMAIEHLPTLVELYIVKARVLKHFGKFEEAAEIMNEGRLLDLQDRFINSKTTKYYFRANQVDKAIDTISLFTKKEEGNVNGCKDLHVMQVNWVLLEAGEAYLRLYKKAAAEESESSAEETDANTETAEVFLGLAIKRFLAVIKNFDIFYNDQLDFHTYCMRKGTPRDYIETVRWEDSLHATPIYSRAIAGLSGLYMGIFDEQLQRQGSDGEENGADPAVQPHKKKNQKKHKKEKAQELKKKEKLVAKVASEDNDKDPLGSSLVSSLRTNSEGKVLDRFQALLQPLLDEAPKYQNTWNLAFELYIRQKKYVLALSAIKHLHALLKNLKDSPVPEYVSRLRQAVDSDDTANVAIKKVVELGLKSAFPDY